MSLPRVLAVSLLSVLALGACERKKPAEAVVPPSSQTAAIAPLSFGITLKAAGCHQRCASFKAEWLSFPAQPALDAALRQVAEAPQGGDVESALHRLGEGFLADAAAAGEPWEQVLKASSLPGLNDVSVIDTENYSYTGGAHGMTAVAYVNWDRRLGRVLKLADVILPGQEPAFWREAQRAHQVWVRGHDDAAALGEGWPFGKTENFALKPDALVLKYQPYAIGPYSEGTPEIRLDYARLGSVLRPEYLPAR